MEKKKGSESELFIMPPSGIDFSNEKEVTELFERVTSTPLELKGTPKTGTAKQSTNDIAIGGKGDQ